MTTPLRVIDNRQPPEPRDDGDGHHLDVVSVFDTIQGEGPFAGRPAVFVRLAGCNLRCPGCDTDYTSNRTTVAAADLWSRVTGLLAARGRPANGSSARPLVVLTGGEPFRQRVGPFVRLLNESGLGVQVETNGTIYTDDFPWYGPNVVVCSPKAGRVAGGLQPYVRDLKYVLRAGAVSEVDGLPTSILGAAAPARPWDRFMGTVWVQPEDEGSVVANERNTAAVVESARRFGYRVCLQQHKLLGVP